MKTNWSHLDKYRFNQADQPHSSSPGSTYGAFQVPYQGKTVVLRIIATDGLDGTVDTGWEHVSVQTYDQLFGKSKIPTWAEMCFVKSLFWEPHECVVQFHPEEKDYVNVHQFVLHLWRYKMGSFPMPPKELV